MPILLRWRKEGAMEGQWGEIGIVVEGSGARRKREDDALLKNNVLGDGGVLKLIKLDNNHIISCTRFFFSLLDLL